MSMCNKNSIYIFTYIYAYVYVYICIYVRTCLHIILKGLGQFGALIKGVTFTIYSWSKQTVVEFVSLLDCISFI